MTNIDEITFDKLGVHFIEPTYWMNDEQPMGLANLLAQFLSPDAGEAWFRAPEGEWIYANEENWEGIQGLLESLASVWSEGQDGEAGFDEFLTQEGRCAVFLDAERFRSCVSSEDGEGLPEEFYVGFEVEWCYLHTAGKSCLTPHLRVTNHWPASEGWAPPGPTNAQVAPLSTEDAATMLETGLWERVAINFMMIRGRMGIGTAAIDVGYGDQRPPLFYYASPTTRLEDADAYLHGRNLKTMNSLGQVLLGSADMRSTEITGGVMEGCLAVFHHSPTVQIEFYLMIPLAGFEEDQIEAKVRFLVDKLHFIDLDATRDVFEITTDLEGSKNFSSLWSGSADLGMRLIELLYSLLPKVAIQERMYSLTHLMSGFLAKLQARAYADSMKRNGFRRSLASFMDSSRSFSQRVLTVQKISGMELLEICDGRTRANRGFAQILGSAADKAQTLADQIAQFSKSLDHTAGLEERKQEREKKRLLEAEEKAAKRLNLVLAAVAGLAAIPLIFGQYDTVALITKIGDWFFFDYGVQISFVAAFITLLGIIIVLGMNHLRGPSSEKQGASLVEEVTELSNELFDGYRGYEHIAMKRAIFNGIKAAAFHRAGLWEDASGKERADREYVHQFDLKLARIAAKSMDRSFQWNETDGLPGNDEEWAQDLEKRICRFVLLGDLLDLRPEDLHMPVTLCLYRFKYGVAGMSSAPVSDWEFEQVMNGFGYTDDEISIIQAWGERDEIKTMTASEFVEACDGIGFNALHKERVGGEG